MKINILYIIHTWIDYANSDRTSIGGTTLHAWDIVKNTLDKFNYFILSVSGNSYILTTYIDGKCKVYNLGVKVTTFKFDRYSKKYKEMLSKLIKLLNINVVHIHHLYGHTYDVLDVLEASTNVTKIMTIHDYFSVCPQINLLYKSNSYCMKERIEKCKECIGKNINVEKRNSVVGKLLEICDNVIIPNESLAKELKSFHKFNKFETIAHGIDLERYFLESKNYRKDKKFNVVFVGVLEALKGSELAKNIIKECKDEKLHFHFWGTSSDSFFKENRDNYTYHGEYKRNEICKILNKNADLVCLLTKCPETYCYTLSEVVYSGVPVLGIDLGAIGERIKKYKSGWLVSKDITAKEMIDKIKEISQNEKEYSTVINNIKKVKLKTTIDMIKETICKYKPKTKVKNIEKYDYDEEIVKAFSKNKMFKNIKKVFKKLFKKSVRKGE